MFVPHIEGAVTGQMYTPRSDQCHPAFTEGLGEGNPGNSTGFPGAISPGPTLLHGRQPEKQSGKSLGKRASRFVSHWTSLKKLGAGLSIEKAFSCLSLIPVANHTRSILIPAKKGEGHIVIAYCTIEPYV